MTIQAKLENFQSWGSADITVDGLTVIVGSSNLGKSAVFRAVRGALRNSIPTAAIRNGMKRTKVSVGVSGTSIEVVRPLSGSVEYTVDGEVFSKLAGEVPTRVAQLGFEPITVGTYSFDPIFASQFDEPFLLSSSPAEVTALLSAFSSTEKLDNGKKELTKRGNTIDAKASVLAETHQSISEKVQKLDSVLPQLRDLRDQVTVVLPKVAKGESVCQTLMRVKEAIRQKAYYSSLYDSTTIENTSPRIDSLANESQSLQKLIGGLVSKNAGIEKLVLLGHDYNSDLEGMRQGFNKLVYIKRAIAARSSLTKARDMRDLLPRDIPSTADAETLLKVLQSIVSLIRSSREKARATSRVGMLKAIESDVLAEMLSAVAILESISTLQDNIEKRRVAEVELGGLDAQMLSLTDELSSARKTLDIVTCPKCHNEFPSSEGHNDPSSN